MSASELNEDQRWEIARRLDKIPTACWADLCIWAVFAPAPEEGDEPEDFVPNTAAGARCAMDASRDGGCYCGKFRTGLAVSDGR
ncbi:hypothetical protein LTT66_18020 [Nocardia gipuzkoensis]|uniref:hypothetical protein n=1 Tax=Nocardia gipuzkoensis TaxID=2749991 RepID=UPI001E5821B5|nr:hypothetical protein [Nocardia gipuzkoensis]UGT71869.1 hypothetical protein LTT66_18020 [Nocardia gipuzkoensis]